MGQIAHTIVMLLGATVPIFIWHPHSHGIQVVDQVIMVDLPIPEGSGATVPTTWTPDQLIPLDAIGASQWRVIGVEVVPIPQPERKDIRSRRLRDKIQAETDPTRRRVLVDQLLEEVAR